MKKEKNKKTDVDIFETIQTEIEKIMKKHGVERFFVYFSFIHGKKKGEEHAYRGRNWRCWALTWQIGDLEREIEKIKIELDQDEGSYEKSSEKVDGYL